MCPSVPFNSKHPPIKRDLILRAVLEHIVTSALHVRCFPRQTLGISGILRCLYTCSSQEKSVPFTCPSVPFTSKATRRCPKSRFLLDNQAITLSYNTLCRVEMSHLHYPTTSGRMNITSMNIRSCSNGETGWHGLCYIIYSKSVISLEDRV